MRVASLLVYSIQRRGCVYVPFVAKFECLGVIQDKSTGITMFILGLGF